MIRFALPGDHAPLKTLWTEAFGDPPEAVDAYFAKRHEDRNMLVDARDGTVAGMLTMLPVTLAADGGRTFPARYIFAVATAERYRRLGVSTGLLEAAHARIREAGEAAAVLVPATPELFAFYGKRGYRTAFSLSEMTLTAEELPPCPKNGRAAAVHAADYTRVRDLAFRGSRLYARWDEAAVAYALGTFAEAGGAAVISWDGGEGCAVWDREENGVSVRELALASGDAATALAVLHELLQARRYTVRLPEGTVPGAAPKPYGMIRWLISEPALAGKPAYIGLAKD